MVGTYLLYLAMATCGPLFINSIIGRKIKASSGQWIGIMIILLILSLIIGGRDEVGTDFPNYVDYYGYYLNGFANLQDIFTLGNSLEPGYLLINWCAAQLGLSISLFFTVIALFSFVLLLKAQDERAYLWPLIIFFFYCQMFGLSMNIIRQSCAIFLFFYAIKYVGQNKLKLFLLITLCTMFHYSSVVLYLALIIHIKWFKFLDNKKLIVLFFILTWVLASNILPMVMGMMPLDVFNAKYLNSLENSDLEMEVSSGLGILTAKIIDLLLICQSDKIACYYKDERIRYTYRLFYIGIIMTNVMGISIFLSRVFLGMVMLRIFILAYTVHYCLKQNDYRKLLGIFLLFISVLQIVMGIKNGAGGMSPYQFMWK